TFRPVLEVLILHRKKCVHRMQSEYLGVVNSKVCLVIVKLVCSETVVTKRSLGLCLIRVRGVDRKFTDPNILTLHSLLISVVKAQGTAYSQAGNRLDLDKGLTHVAHEVEGLVVHFLICQRIDP